MPVAISAVKITAPILRSLTHRATQNQKKSFSTLRTMHLKTTLSPTSSSSATTALRRLQHTLKTSTFSATITSYTSQNRSTSTASGSSSTTEERLAPVLQKKLYGGRTFILNRPKALNALSLEMIRSMTPQLKAWEISASCKTVIVTSNSRPRAFCAGGDVRTLVEHQKAGNISEAVKFFEEEYRLNHLIGSMKKPYVALLDGITMGGGVGISVHGSFRVATENTVFAMPETGIGFFPDVGGSFFLPRLDGEIGTYLGLTGQRLKAEDVFYSGIATHYIPSSKIPELEERLNELESEDHDVVNMAIEEFSETPTKPPFSAIGGKDREIIDQCFSNTTVEGIIDALKKNGSEFALKTVGQLEKMCPSSMKVTLAMLREGKQKSFQNCLQMEYHIASMILQHSDFAEGVTALLVEKRPAQWKPPKLEDITEESVRNGFFTHQHEPKLVFDNPTDFNEYPYRRFAGPTESDIQQIVTGTSPAAGGKAWNAQELEQYFAKASRWKHGVREKVRNVIERKCSTDAEGWLTWKN